MRDTVLESIRWLLPWPGVLLIVAGLPLLVLMVRGAVQAFLAVLAFAGAGTLLRAGVEEFDVATLLIGSTVFLIVIDLYMTRRRLRELDARIGSLLEATQMLKAAEERRQAVLARQPNHASARSLEKIGEQTRARGE